MAWAKNGTQTNGSTTDPIDLTLDSSLQFNFSIWHTLHSGTVNSGLRVGNSTIDTGNNYAWRHSFAGGTDTTGTSTASYVNLNAPDGDELQVMYFINIAAEEKLVIAFGCGENTSGAGTAPRRHETVGKWTNTSNQIDIIESYDSGGAGSYLTDSNLSALGTD